MKLLALNKLGIIENKLSPLSTSKVNMTKINTRTEESMKIGSKNLRTLDLKRYNARMTTTLSTPEDVCIHVGFEFYKFNSRLKILNLVNIRDSRFLGCV